MGEVETVKIKCEPCAGNEVGEVIINKCDFNPEVHQLVGCEDAQVLSSEFVPPDGAPVDPSSDRTPTPDGAPAELPSDPVPTPPAEPPASKPSRKGR